MTNYNVVLFEPEIPQNTGNIVRLCACTNCTLYLVGKLGFVLDNKHMKRAGLDYWNDVQIFKYNSFEELINDKKESNFYFLTTKATKKYTDIKYSQNDFFVFGPETRGIPESLLHANWNNCVTIPMVENKRSLNLSNSVAIVIYEAIRQGNCI